MEHAGRATGRELSVADHAVITSLASAMRFVGTTLAILGAMGLIYGIVSGEPARIAAGIVAAGLNVAAGVWLRAGANSMQASTTAQEDAIGNLMKALAELRKVFALQRVVIAVALVALAVAFALGVVWGAM